MNFIFIDLPKLRAFFGIVSPPFFLKQTNGFVSKFSSKKGSQRLSWKTISVGLLIFNIYFESKKSHVRTPCTDPFPLGKEWIWNLKKYYNSTTEKYRCHKKLDCVLHRKNQSPIPQKSFLILLVKVEHWANEPIVQYLLNRFQKEPIPLDALYRCYPSVLYDPLLKKKRDFQSNFLHKLQV